MDVDEPEKETHLENSLEKIKVVVVSTDQLQKSIDEVFNFFHFVL